MQFLKVKKSLADFTQPMTINFKFLELLAACSVRPEASSWLTAQSSQLITQLVLFRDREFSIPQQSERCTHPYA
jgi:hypothetical protein